MLSPRIPPQARYRLNTGQRLNRFLNLVLIGRDITQARRRIRWAWIAGFTFAAVGLLNALLINLLSLFFGFDPEVEIRWSGGQLAWVVFESGLIATLSFGVLKRVRLAAVSLFFYFWVSRIPLLALGLIVDPRDDVAHFLIMQVLFAYLFLQGMRGVLTFHFLTHPPYTTAASSIQESPA